MTLSRTNLHRQALTTVAAVLLSLSWWTAPAAAAEKDLREHWQVEKLNWQGPIVARRAIEVRNELGDVRARLSSDDQVYVSAVIQGHEDDPYEADIQIGDKDGRMTIEATFVTSQSFDPAILVEGMEKRRIDLTVIVPLGARFEVHTIKGLIEAKGLESDMVAMSMSGNIVTSILGSLHAHTERGEITATFKSTDWNEAPSLATLTGDVNVWLPLEADATVRAQTSGLITTDYSIEIESEPAPSEKKSATARIGKGKHQLSIQSTKGSVRILRSRG